tara:strand:- start:2506 stop:2898 length:393 start_codon:yes stop_codon:yes gene_type:complete
MKALLIDPFMETVQEIDYSGDWKDIRTLLKCDIFATVYFDDMSTDSVFVDDEGVFVDDQRFFKLGNYTQPLAGYGLVLGCNEEGDSVDCMSTLEDVAKQVEWCPIGTHVARKFEVIFHDDDLTVNMIEET